MSETDKGTGGFLIPEELQAECERMLSMPVYPPINGLIELADFWNPIPIKMPPGSTDTMDESS